MSEPPADPELSRVWLQAILGIGESGTKFSDTLALDPASLLKQAGAGNLLAQRDMACRAYDAYQAYRDDDAVAIIALIEALAFARLAATQGQVRDREVLLFLYAQFAKWQAEHGRADIGTRFEAAGLNLAEDLANEGSEELAEMIVKAGDALPAETFREAKRQRQEAAQCR